MTEIKRCSTCEAVAPFEGCYVQGEGISCARLAMYENAKLPAAPTVYTHEVEGEVVAKAKYDELSVYASRLAVDLSLLNGIITRAARDAQRYVDAAERGLT